MSDKGCILVVDDDPLILKMLANILSTAGYTVHSADSGELALASVAASLPALILLDVSMPVMDGFEVVQRLHAQQETSAIPIIMLSGITEKEQQVKGLKLGAVDFITKPFDSKELLTRVHTHIELRRLRDGFQNQIADLRLLNEQLQQEIAERKKGEEALRESEARFAQLAEQSSTITWEVTALGLYTHVSPVAETVLGYSPDEVVGRKYFYELHPESGREALKKAAFGVFERKEPFQNFVSAAQTKDGRVVWLSTNGLPILNADGTLRGYRGSNTDITERKCAEAEKVQLEAQNRQLQKAESLGRMAGAIAHTFNNQLSAVIGNLELALMGLTPDAQIFKNLTIAMQAAEKAAAVSGQMQIYLGQSFDKPKLLDLSEVCRRDLPILQAFMPDKVVLATDLPTDGPAVMVNENQIQQALNILITNAWEAIGENEGSIHVAVKMVSPAHIPAAHCYPPGCPLQDTAYACLEVADSGCGIADKDIEKLFDPFFTSKFTGRGMGLAMTLGIVRAHGGVITVESQPGQGSTFRVFLPASEEKIMRQPDKARGFAEWGTVLLVDDEENMRTMTAAMLASLGCTVLEAKDGVEAVEAFHQHQDEIHCVLCNLAMPRMNGWENLAARLKLSPDIPVILSSVYEETRIMAGYNHELPHIFLGMPYKIKEIGEAISLALANRK